MLENMDTNKRLLLAALVSFMFFFAYDYFYYADATKTQETQQIEQNTPKNQNSVQTSQNSAPAVETPKLEASKNITPPTSATADEIIASVTIQNAEFQVDSLGRIASAVFKEKNHTETLSLFGAGYVKPLEVRFGDQALNDEAFKTVYSPSAKRLDATTSKKELILTQRLKDLTVTKTITFYPAGNYEVRISASKPVEYFVTPGFRPNTEVDRMTVHGLLVQKFDDTTEVVKDGDATGHESFRSIKIASSFDRYYTTLFYDFNNPFDIWVNKVEEEEPLSFMKSENGQFMINGYIGPKNVKKLKSIDERLVPVVEYGIFTFLSAPLFIALDFINDHTGNWGWTIIIFITLVRIVLFPLTHKGMVSMAKLKELSPKMKEIQAKYKGDPQKLQLHMMELYKKNGANPMGGCLPFLLQIPIFFAIYRVLLNAIELRGSDWLYIGDLSAMDPYYILPVLMGASMYFQQKISPTTITDPMQEKLFKFLPLIFMFFFFTFPAGLVLYWFANNILSIIQQYLANKTIDKQKAAK